MNSILRKIVGFWFWLWTMISAPFYGLILAFVILFGNAKVKRRFARLSYFYVPRWLCYPCGVKFETKGLKKLQKGKQYILVSNHQSTLDIFANPATCPVHFKYLAKDEVRTIPLLGAIAKPFCIFVKRGDRKSRSDSMEALIEAIEKDGSSLLIYPEGTRNRTGEPLKKFYDGAFRIAIKTKTPIVVQTLLNTGYLGPPDDLFNLSPGTVHAIWDDPIETSELTIDDLPILKERVRSIMLQNLENYATESKRHA